MSRVTNSMIIGRPVEDVFAVLTDVEQTGKWFPGNVEEHWTSAPPHGVGSTRHAIVTMFGRRTENDAVTTEYDPPHRAAMRGTTPNAPFDAILTFAPDRVGHAWMSSRTSILVVGPGCLGRSWQRCTARPGLAASRSSSG